MPQLHMTRLRWLGAALLVPAALLAWANLDLLQAAFESNPNRDASAATERGRALWQLDCAACHGAQGRGDGPATAALARQPKDLTRIARPPIFPDGILAYRIANGGTVMPAWKGTLTQQDIWDLVSFIRAQGVESTR